MPTNAELVMWELKGEKPSLRGHRGDEVMRRSSYSEADPSKDGLDD